jgi:ABC-type branched-subunit amino acid transport system ATPase component
MQGTRQNDLATASAGGSPRLYRGAGIIISAIFGGVAGVLYGPVQGYITPDGFGLSITLLFLIIVVLGGIGSVTGVALAAIGLTYAQQLAQSATTAWPLFYGAFVMVLLVITPRGVAGLLEPIWRRVRRISAPSIEVSSNGTKPAGTMVLSEDTTLQDVRPSPPDDGPVHAPTRSIERSDQPVLELVDIKRRFGGVRALDGVSLTVQTGTVHGLVGPNGSGKTTLLNVISAFIRPQEGRILSFGEDITRKSSVNRARYGIGRSFQHPSVLLESTVLEKAQLGILHSMSLPSRLRSATAIPGTERAARVHEALQLTELEQYQHVRAADLSYGHRRLLDIVRVLVGNPSLVLLDEPTSGVGGPGVEVVKRLIQTLRGRGISVLVVEHNMRFVMELCDWVTVLDYGKVISRGRPEDVTHDDAVIEAYLGAPDA